MPESDLPAGVPGWKHAPCLGCDGRVSAHRDPHVTISGPRDGSVLIVTGAEPQYGFTTRPGVMVQQTMYVLGVAHRACIAHARQRLETGSVPLADILPTAEVSPDPDGPERLDLPPAPDNCAFCGQCEEMSDEDVWPKWVSKLLAQQFGGFSIKSPYGPRGAATLNVKAPVGRTCNNQWLSVLENDISEIMKPMILGPGLVSCPAGP